jgi:MFS family permease
VSARTRTEQTYFYERLRAVSSGILETAATTFLLLIAVRWFEAGAIAKALVAASGSFGLMLAPALVSWVERRRWPTGKAASMLAACGALGFGVMALVPVLPVFVLGSVVALTSTSSAIPLLTQMYQENYPALDRGRLFSKTVMIRIAVAAVFAELAGRLLSGHTDRFRWLLLLFGVALAFSSFCLGRCPTRPLAASGGQHPFRALRFARDDKVFRLTLIAWMLMGFANLMMLPMRVEYLANPRYGLALPASTIALVTAVVPNLVRLGLSPLWGRLFDRMNFFVLRAVLNLGFALGILAFFLSDDLVGLILGAMVFGVANAGGDVAWSLWVTKFAPPDRVADYMSVHTFFTGVRGFLAPLTAFVLIKGVPVPLLDRGVPILTLGYLSAGLILLSVLLLLREARFGRRARRAAPLVEEVSD